MLYVFDFQLDQVCRGKRKACGVRQTEGTHTPKHTHTHTHVALFLVLPFLPPKDVGSAKALVYLPIFVCLYNITTLYIVCLPVRPWAPQPPHRSSPNLVSRCYILQAGSPSHHTLGLRPFCGQNRGPTLHLLLVSACNCLLTQRRVGREASVELVLSELSPLLLYIFPTLRSGWVARKC